MMPNPYNLTPMPTVRNKFMIENDLLYSCIAHPLDIDNAILNPNEFHSVTSTKDGLGYIILVYLVKQALGFNRYPFYEDRILSHMEYLSDSRKQNLKLALSMIEKDYEAILNEVLSLYHFTQQILSDKGLSHVKISRAVKDNKTEEGHNYASHIVYLCQLAKNEGRNSIKLEFDVLNSFASDTTYPGVLFTPHGTH